MGVSTSLPDDSDTSFTAGEVTRLAARFRKIDSDKSGTISVSEFLSLPELGQNPLARRIIEMFDDDNSGEVDFQEFLSGLSLIIRGDTQAKLKFAFRIYDIDNDGFISNGELYQILKMMVGTNLPDESLQQIVDKTILLVDGNGDGKLSFEEFSKLVSRGNLGVKMAESCNI